MVEEEVEQEILGEWNSIAEDQEAIAALTRRTRNLLRGFKGNLVFLSQQPITAIHSTISLSCFLCSKHVFYEISPCNINKWAYNVNIYF
jgi:hypothetical protein